MSRPGHGGARKGAGRKPTGRRLYQIRMAEEAMARIRAEARARRVPIGQPIEERFPAG